MFYGSISGLYRKGPSVFWLKEWGSINSVSYCEHILPVVRDYIASHPGLVFQQDDASGHASAYTKLRFIGQGIQPITWPPFSLDLNPIETVWDWLNDLVEQINPEYHRSHAKLQKQIEQALESISEERVRELVSRASMRRRCQAVIDAKEHI